MLTNYYDHIADLTHSELLVVAKRFLLSPEVIEIMECENANVTHNTNINGPDGYRKGKPVEIKSQRYISDGLVGRLSYSDISNNTYFEKIQNNEETIVVGIDSKTLEVYYRFSFNFNAIAEEYKRQLDNQKIDAAFTYRHYVYHSSFKILYMADYKTLTKNCVKFDSGFLRWMMSTYEEEIKNSTILNDFAALLAN